MDDATSLDRLHDIVVPPEVPWWPPAPGWYVILGLTAAAILALLVRQWLRWHANAYRRTALRELDSAQTVSAISEVLRRTALAFEPRANLATLTGNRWPTWLADRSPDPMPEPVREQLAISAYRQAEQPEAIGDLRAYAAAWIAHHRIPNTSSTSSATESSTR